MELKLRDNYEVIFDLGRFWARYKEFREVSRDVVLERADMALDFFPNFKICNESTKLSLWFAITAHLLVYHDDLNNDDFNGKNNRVVGNITSVSVGGVSTSFQVPETRNTNIQNFFKQTSYGLHALSLIENCRPAVLYYKGKPEGDAFLGVYGISSQGRLGRRGWRC